MPDRHCISARPTHYRLACVPSLILSIIMAATVGAYPVADIPLRIAGLGPEDALHALRTYVTDLDPDLDVRIFGPEELLRVKGLNPLNTTARATSWMAVMPFADRGSAVWVVATATEQGVQIRSGVYRTPTPTLIGRLVHALTDRLPNRWQPPEVQIARMIGNRTYQYPTPLRSY
jgi:hypothetical protein